MSDLAAGLTREWLDLREPADRAARSGRLARRAAQWLGAQRTPGGRRPLVVHDLGAGSGSQGRWLAPLLAGPQHWVLHDRDADLLAAAAADPPRTTANGAPVSLEVRPGDLRDLRPEGLAGASLVTASALLDMLTVEEVEHLVGCCVTARCPMLFSLTVVGRVELLPANPWDRVLGAAFDDHQRRTTGGRTLLGPEASDRAVAFLRSCGAEVVVRPSRWRLGAAHMALTDAWLVGWVGAAVEQRPELAAVGSTYLEDRRRALAAGVLEVVVHHVDLLARPARSRR